MVKGDQCSKRCYPIMPGNSVLYCALRYLLSRRIDVDPLFEKLLHQVHALFVRPFPGSAPREVELASILPTDWHQQRMRDSDSMHLCSHFYLFGRRSGRNEGIKDIHRVVVSNARHHGNTHVECVVVMQSLLQSPLPVDFAFENCFPVRLRQRSACEYFQDQQDVLALPSLRL